MNRLTTTILMPILIPLILGAGSLRRKPAESSVTRSTESNWSYGDRSASYEITIDEVSSTPPWVDPSKESPPLSIGQAVEISKQQLSIYVPEVSDWVLGSINLVLFDEPDRWYYVASWRPASNDNGHWLHVPVLMNGVAVKLRLEPSGPAKKRP